MAEVSLENILTLRERGGGGDEPESAENLAWEALVVYSHEWSSPYRALRLDRYVDIILFQMKDT